MRKSVLVKLLFVALGSTALATAPTSFAVAHQGHNDMDGCETHMDKPMEPTEK